MHELGGAGDLVGDGDRGRLQLVADAVALAARSRSGVRPAQPIATSVVPCRQARPNESLTITATRARSARAAARAGAAPRRPDRAGAGRACPARARSRRRPRRRRRRSRGSSRRSRAAAASADDPRALAQDHLDVAWVALAGESRRALRGLDVVRGARSAPSALRHGLLRDDDDVAVLQLPARSRQPRSARRGRPGSSSGSPSSGTIVIGSLAGR